jgi:hypothetical protein
MKLKRYLRSLTIIAAALTLMSTGAIAQENTSPKSGATAAGTPPAPIISFKNYPDHVFQVRDYISGMQKGGHNLLIWKDPSVNLSQYTSVKVTDFGDRLLPERGISCGTFIPQFNSTFRSSLKLPQTDAPNALLIDGAVVECNPGSVGARMWIGYGAGKAGAAVVCEVYVPGSIKPCIRIYTRDTASFGGDSVAMLNYIFSQLGLRLATTLNIQLATK